MPIWWRPKGLHEDVTIRDAAGHVQSWYYPSRTDCLVLPQQAYDRHALGPKARQMNRDLPLSGWRHREPAAPLESARAVRHGAERERHRIAADARAVGRHEPQRRGSGALLSRCQLRALPPARRDAWPTSMRATKRRLAQQNLIDGPVLIDQNVDRARVISPHDPWRSVALMRVDTNGEIRMPPLARNTDRYAGRGAVTRIGFESLPGRDVLAPPTIAPAGGSFDHAVSVTLSSSEPGAEIHYTLDGSVPGPKGSALRRADPHRRPRHAARPLRSRKGFTRSVIAQQTYLVGQ